MGGRVTRLGAGAAMMRDLDLVRAVFRAVRAATPLPVTVKTRAFWTADGPTALDVARVAEEEGLTAITVHPRPGKGHHNEGRADWALIREWGRIGRPGRRQTDDYPDQVAAEMARLVRRRQRHGDQARP